MRQGVGDPSIDLELAIQLVKLEEGWFQGLRKSDAEDLSLIIGELTNLAKISLSTLKEARTSLPSFADKNWGALATAEGYPRYLQLPYAILPQYMTKVYLLPQSFHEPIALSMWHSQDAYLEVRGQERETAGLRILDVYILPIVGLFETRLFDMPNKALPDSIYSTGCEVDHQITFIDCILFLVVELHRHIDLGENLGHFFLELRSAAETNKKMGLPDLRIGGLLTDCDRFFFYTYDPLSKVFSLDKILSISIERESQIMDMISISNKIFSLILFGYTAVTSTLNEQGINQLNKTDSSQTSESAPGKIKGHSHYRWGRALRHVENSHAKFTDPAATVEILEENSIEALKALSASVRSLLRPYPPFNTVEDPDDLASLTRRLVLDGQTNLLEETRQGLGDSGSSSQFSLLP